MTDSNQDFDWEKYNNRDKSEIRTEIMTTCFHLHLHATAASKILFSAGYPVKAETVEKFFTGRRNYLASKRAANKPVESNTPTTLDDLSKFNDGFGEWEEPPFN